MSRVTTIESSTATHVDLADDGAEVVVDRLAPVDALLDELSAVGLVLALGVREPLLERRDSLFDLVTRSWMCGNPRWLSTQRACLLALGVDEFGAVWAAAIPSSGERRRRVRDHTGGDDVTDLHVMRLPVERLCKCRPVVCHWSERNVRDL